MINFEIARDRMVREQLRPRSISDRRVLEIFGKVPRHLFVADKYRAEAYADHPLPIGEGQTISQPYMAAFMTESLSLRGKESVLEVGTGSGYQAAILAELSGEVYTVERSAPLAESARETLDRFGYKNIKIRVCDGTLGWKDHAPFDRIIVTAGSPRLPQSLITQLADGGRMVIPVGGERSQALTLVEKKGANITTAELCGCVFVPLIGEDGWKR